MERIVRTLNEVVEIGLKYKNNWYRGHSKIFDSLSPRVFRNEFSSGQHLIASSMNPEIHIIEEFKRLAPSLSQYCPNPNDELEWLILMQHFGAPTRLLDWSESILVATFFAVTENPKEDAQLWRLYPQALNHKSIGFEGFPIIKHNSELTFLAQEPSYADIKKLTNKLQLDREVKSPIAFHPVLSFPRITSQAGTFTIHPNSATSSSIQDLLHDRPKYLSTYVIPAHCKAKILHDLTSLGINYRFLFASLEGLSMDLCLKYSDPFWNVWGQPDE